MNANSSYFSRQRELLNNPHVAELRGAYRPAPVPPAWPVEPRPAMQRVEVVEPESGPWQRDGAFGRYFRGAIPTTEGDTLAVFNNDAIMGPPRARVVHLYRSDRGISAHGGNYGFRASVTYGVGGAQNNLLLDWTQGGQFSIVASTIRVEAVTYRPLDPVAYSVSAGAVVLGALLGVDGQSTPRDPPTFTTQTFDVLAGGNVTFAVPDLARRVIPQLSLNGNAYADCEMNLLDFGPVYSAASFTEAIARDGVPLRGETHRVFFENNGANAMQVALLFQLGL